MSKFGKRSMLVFVLITLFILSACGGNNSSSTNVDSKTGESSDNSSAAPSTEDAKEGGDLRIALSATPKTLDPISYTATYESQVIRSIADTLVIYSDDLSEIQPSLATEWTVSDDLKVYSFKLRDNAYFQPGKFQDGRNMTAEDVKYSLERSANESAMNRLRMVEKVEVVGEYEVDIYLDAPNAALLAVLTDAGNIIIPHEEVEGWGEQFGQHLIGTGPFKFEEWAKDDFIKLSRHEKYWAGEVYLDNVYWSFITDANMMVNSLRAGDIDIATDVKGQNRVIVENDQNLSLLATPGLSIEYAALNMMEGPTADIRVREAINLAVDVDTLVQGVFQWGGAERSYLPLPKSSWGYDTSLEKEIPGFDPERARQLLAEAGYPNGFDTEVYVIESRVAHATIFQNQLKENLNINVEIKAVEWGTFSDVASKGKAPIYIMGWTWYPDPDFFLYQMFHSKQIGALGNGYGFNNSKVDELLVRATAQSVDQEERKQIYHEILRLIVEEMPRVELTNVEITAGINSKVQGFNVRPDNSYVIVNPNNNVWVKK